MCDWKLNNNVFNFKRGLERDGRKNFRYVWDLITGIMLRRTYNWFQGKRIGV